MSQNKRRPYSEWSQEEKDKKKTKRREAAEKKKQSEDALIPVLVQQHDSSESFHSINAHEKFGSEHQRIRVSSSAMGLVNNMVSMGSSSAQSGMQADEPCLLYDISVGVVPGTLMPLPRIGIRSVPCEAYVLPEEASCHLCLAKRFPYEPPGFCCARGDVSLYPVAVSNELQELFAGTTPQSAHFRQYIRPFNDTFAFTSVKVILDKKYAINNNGIFTYRAQGPLCHYIHNLYPSGSAPPSFLQLYFYDTEAEVNNRRAFATKLQPATVEKVIGALELNPYSIFFRSLRTVPNLDTFGIELKANPRMGDSTYSAPAASQVAALWSDTADGTNSCERDIIVHQHNGYQQQIRYRYGCYDPLQYPLLFPRGEPGWPLGIQKTNNRAQARAQERVLPSHSMSAEELITNEAAVYEENADKENMVSCREFYAYRLQIRPSTNLILLKSGRLLQKFVVDMYVKIETSRLDFFRLKQREIRADLYQGIVDSITQGETQGSNVGKRIVLPSSFIGGPRDMRKRYMDAMALVEKYGKPDIFLTMTCNPKWVEITQELQNFEEAQNRPDLVARVFRSKFEHLRREVIKELFGPIAAYTFVIEFQKRGLPHVHMLLIMKKAYKINTVDRFDAFISAEIPDRNKQPHLYVMVLKHMMHGPSGTLNENNVCMEKKKCKDHYPRGLTEETMIAPNGYPIYRRTMNTEPVEVRGHLLNNAWVVPYNPYLLAMFDCHINVEVCSTIKAVKYLYKYIYKGHDKVSYRLISTTTDEIIDEIEQFRSARWVSPPEAIWRIYRFPIHEMNPAVISLQLHLEGCQMISFKKQTDLRTITDNDAYSRTMLTQFFFMNDRDTFAKEKRLLYRNFPEHFVWNKQTRAWKVRLRGDVIGRIITANPSEGERYYLRMLLNHVPAPTSYSNLKTLHGVEYDTFREAAVAYGLLETDNSSDACMQEASTYQMPSSLRQLFCTILVYCGPLNPKELFLKFEDEMIDDYISLQKMTKEMARQELLHVLNSELESMGRNLNQYGLSDLISDNSRKSAVCKEIQDEMDFVVSEDDLNSVSLLNEYQFAAFKAITDAVSEGKSTAFFIDGPRGTGKTFLYQAILATVRSQRKIALATASSGVAASILPNGRTAHSRFKIPIGGDEKISCNVGKQSDLAKLLKEVALIIWDEASMAKKQSIEAVDDLLRDLTGNDTLFGGKIVVLGGDFRQVLPVIPKGTKADCMNLSLIRSYIWPSLNKFRLEQNMHARADPIFSEFILRIGDGVEPENGKGQVKIPDSLIIKPRTTRPTLDDLIAFVFPALTDDAADSLSITDSAILTPKNNAVDEINDTMMSKFPGEEHIYLSFNETTDSSQQGLYIDFLNSICLVGMPAHRLVLKKNCPIVLLRNINPSKGLCNGTRLICLDFQPHVIVAQIAVGEKKGNIVFIPRISLQPNDPQLYPIEFSRRQFPVRVCFAMTINKAQGQTLNTVGVYLPEPVFAHGQLYVALSRATTAAKIRVQLEQSDFDPLSAYFTLNIVYKE